MLTTDKTHYNTSMTSTTYALTWRRIFFHRGLHEGRTGSLRLDFGRFRWRSIAGTRSWMHVRVTTLNSINKTKTEPTMTCIGTAKITKQQQRNEIYLTDIFQENSGKLSLYCNLLEQRMTETVVTTEAVRRIKLQPNGHQCQQTNTQHLTGRMPFLSVNQNCWSVEVKSTAEIAEHKYKTNIVITFWDTIYHTHTHTWININTRKQHWQTTSSMHIKVEKVKDHRKDWNKDLE